MCRRCLWQRHELRQRLAEANNPESVYQQLEHADRGVWSKLEVYGVGYSYMLKVKVPIGQEREMSKALSLQHNRLQDFLCS